VRKSFHFFSDENHFVNILIIWYLAKFLKANSLSLQCQIAKIPFCLVTYGFGSSETYDYKFESFKNLANYFLDLT
ncbi:MAG: hypothetical protein EAZ07_10035, partial [Cytophagales bacterium]